MYGPHSRGERAGLWKELINVLNVCGVPTLVMGDFSEVSVTAERKETEDSCNTEYL